MLGGTPFLVVDPLAVIKLLVKILFYLCVCVISHDVHVFYMKSY